MITLELLKAGRKIKEVKFPEHPSEITLSKFVQFEVAVKELYGDVVKDLSNVEFSRIVLTHKHLVKRTKQILEIVSKFLDVDPGMLITGTVGDFSNSLLSKSNNNLMNLFANIIRVAYDYSPPVVTEENNTFKYKGELWNIPYFTKTFQLHMAKESELNPSLRTGDVIEIQNSLKILEEQKEKTEDISNYEWMKYLTVLAVLASKKGEELPDTLKGIKQRKEQRMKYFEGIDMVTGLNLDFFLGCTLQI